MNSPASSLSPRPRSARSWRSPALLALSAGLALAPAAGLVGCASPLYQPSESDLRRSIIQSTQRELLEPQQYPAMRPLDRVSRVDTLGLRPEIMSQLTATSGLSSYEGKGIALTPDLTGQPQKAVGISLQRAIITAVENNLQVQFARVAPAISEAQREAAEAAFDYVIFANSNFQHIDRPQVASSFGGVDQINTDTFNSTVGVRRRLPTGGQVTLQQTWSVADSSTPGSIVRPNPAHTTALTAEIQQPLLRNFGTDVNLSEVRLAGNAERDAIMQLKQNMLSTIIQTEQAYWNLVGNYRQLQIAQRLLDRGVEVQEVLRVRMEKARDVRAAQFSDAVSNVESRRADVIRAENQLRQTSDLLKQLMNDPGLTLGSETLLLPVDATADAPIAFSLADCVLTAIQNRPEIQRALLAIDDASIRQTVADNQRLPQLDLQAQVQFNGLAEEAGRSFSQEADGRFVDYIVGLAFEQPVGNRGAEAQFRQRRLERTQSVLAYRDVVQRVVADVKTRLRTIDNNYRLIEQTRAFRLAAAENLRALEVEEKTITGLTAEFLDLKLRRQQALAAAEVQELLALTEYNTAVSALYAAMGTALERNRIKFEVPAYYQTPGAFSSIAPAPTTPEAPVPSVPAPQGVPGEGVGSPAGAGDAPAAGQDVR